VTFGLDDQNELSSSLSSHSPYLADWIVLEMHQLNMRGNEKYKCRLIAELLNGTLANANDVGRETIKHLARFILNQPNLTKIVSISTNNATKFKHGQISNISIGKIIFMLNAMKFEWTEKCIEKDAGGKMEFVGHWKGWNLDRFTQLHKIVNYNVKEKLIDIELFNLAVDIYSET